MGASTDTACGCEFEIDCFECETEVALSALEGVDLGVNARWPNGSKSDIEMIFFYDLLGLFLQSGFFFFEFAWGRGKDLNEKNKRGEATEKRLK